MRLSNSEDFCFHFLTLGDEVAEEVAAPVEGVEPGAGGIKPLFSVDQSGPT